VYLGDFRLAFENGFESVTDVEMDFRIRVAVLECLQKRQGEDGVAEKRSLPDADFFVFAHRDTMYRVRRIQATVDLIFV